MTKPHESGESGPKPATSGERPAAKGDEGAALLPDSTEDERGLVQGMGDDWYEQERPPHHG